MAIGTLNLQPNRNACPLSQQASFDAAFGAVGWIATGFFPRPMVLWSSRHQEPANSNPSLRVCRSRTTLPPTGARRSLCFPILESGHGPLNQNKCPLHPVPSTVASSAFPRCIQCLPPLHPVPSTVASSAFPRCCQCLPLAARSQHEENAVQNLPVRNARPMASQRMYLLLAHRNQRLDQLPQLIRYRKLLNGSISFHVP